MFKRFHYHPHYFSRKVSPELKELFFSVGILETAISMVAIFEPIYLYTIGFTIPHILLFNVAIYSLYFLIVPLGGKFVAHFGVRVGIVAGSFSLIGYYVALFAVKEETLFIVAAAVLIALQKMFYWPAYHKDFIDSSDAANRGREISFIKALVLTVNVLGPIVGGFILALTSFAMLFLIVVGLIIISNIPLYLSKPRFPEEDFSFFHAFRMLVERAHRRATLAYIGFGEELVEFTIWPLFIYLIVESPVSLGLYLGIGTFVSALILLKIGQWIDTRGGSSFLSFGSAVLSLSWLSRIFVGTPLWAFTANVFGGTAKDSVFIALSTITYARAKKEHPLVYGVFLEQSLAFGKALIGLVLALVFAFVGFSGIWLLTAAFALLYAALPRSN